MVNECGRLRELGPGDVDAIPELAAGAVVDGHVLLVFEDVASASRVVVDDDGPAWEVPRRTVVLGGAENQEAARSIRVRRRACAAVEYLAREVGVAARIPGNGWVACGLPVLARSPERAADGAVLDVTDIAAREAPDGTVWHREVTLEGPAHAIPQRRAPYLEVGP